MATSTEIKNVMAERRSRRGSDCARGFEHLNAYLARTVEDKHLIDLIQRLARSCCSIAHLIANAVFNGHQSSAGQINPQGEDQAQLDVLADAEVQKACAGNPALTGLISEEVEDILWYRTPRQGDFVLSYDPLDGSSNLNVNLSVGSIFSIAQVPQDATPKYLPQGEDVVAAGYAIYGPSTMFVLCVDGRVNGFTLDTALRDFRLTHPDLTVREDNAEFAINVSRQAKWDPAVQSYIDNCLAGETGHYKTGYNMRWTASMVADVHRILTRGGVFLYPEDAGNTAKGGKLRLLYEAVPMAKIVETAGGSATNGQTRLLDIVPQHHHQRTGVVLGAAREVERVADAYRQKG